jgi:hypothetical protein
MKCLWKFASVHDVCALIHRYAYRLLHGGFLRAYGGNLQKLRFIISLSKCIRTHPFINESLPSICLALWPCKAPRNRALPKFWPAISYSLRECALILGMPCPLGWAPSHALTPKSLKCEAPPEFQRAATDQWGFGHEYLEHINVRCCNLKTIKLDTVPIWMQNRKRSWFIWKFKN